LHTILHITDSFVSKEVLATARERHTQRGRREGEKKKKQTYEAKHRAVALYLPLRRIERKEEKSKALRSVITESRESTRLEETTYVGRHFEDLRMASSSPFLNDGRVAGTGLGTRKHVRR
jgi:hypothetical protein